LQIYRNEVGIAQFAKGDFEEALKEFADSLGIWQDLGINLNTIRALNNIGSTYFALDELDSAMEAFEEALEIQRSYLIDYFGSKLKQPKERSEALKRALTGVSETLCNMAYVHKASGSSSTARFFMEEALTIHKTLAPGDPTNEIVDLLSLLEPDNVHL